jgi:hypothetical protein
VSNVFKTRTGSPLSPQRDQNRVIGEISRDPNGSEWNAGEIPLKWIRRYRGGIAPWIGIGYEASGPFGGDPEDSVGVGLQERDRTRGSSFWRTLWLRGNGLCSSRTHRLAAPIGRVTPVNRRQSKGLFDGCQYGGGVTLSVIDVTLHGKRGNYNGGNAQTRTPNITRRRGHMVPVAPVFVISDDDSGMRPERRVGCTAATRLSTCCWP